MNILFRVAVKSNDRAIGKLHRERRDLEMEPVQLRALMDLAAGCILTSGAAGFVAPFPPFRLSCTPFREARRIIFAIDATWKRNFLSHRRPLTATTELPHTGPPEYKRGVGWR